MNWNIESASTDTVNYNVLLRTESVGSKYRGNQVELSWQASSSVSLPISYFNGE